MKLNWRLLLFIPIAIALAWFGANPVLVFLASALAIVPLASWLSSVTAAWSHQENLESITKEQQGFLVGLKRRRNAELRQWLNAVDETKWVNCPCGINAQERKTDPPRTLAQEVASGIEGMRVIVIDSDERRAYGESASKRWNEAAEAQEAQGACRHRRLETAREDWGGRRADYAETSWLPILWLDA